MKYRSKEYEEEVRLAVMLDRPTALECADTECIRLEAENARYVDALTIIANFRFRNVFSNADIFRQAEIALAALKK